MIRKLLFLLVGWGLLTSAQQRPLPLTIERIAATADASLVPAPRWSPDSKWIACFDAATAGLILAPVGQPQNEVRFSKEALNQNASIPSHQQDFWNCLWLRDGSGLLLNGEHSIIRIDLASRKPELLMKSSSPLDDVQLSPDGKWLSYVRDFHIEICSLSSRRTQMVSNAGTSHLLEGAFDSDTARAFHQQHGYWWAPDSKAIAYVETKEPASDRGRGGAALPITRLKVVAIPSRKAHAVAVGDTRDCYVPRVAWLQDSRHIAVEILNRSQTELRVVIAGSEEPAQLRNVLVERDRYWINVGEAPRFLNQGRQMLWSSERSGHRHLYLYDVGAGQAHVLTAGSWDVTSVAHVDAARGFVYFVSTMGGPLERQMYRVGLNGAGLSAITHGSGTHSVLFAPSGGQFLDTYSTTDAPPAQTVFTVDDARPPELLGRQASGLESSPGATTDFVSIRTHDGVRLDAMVMRPRDFHPAQKYPAIVSLKGGPGEQAVVNGWRGWESLWDQYLTEHGFVVFMVDGRGSGGRGHRFEEPIHYRLGAQEIADLREALSWLRKLSYVDGGRVGLWGQGYGGYLTLHALFEHPDEFKAGVAVAPVVDWRLQNPVFTERYLGELKTHAMEYQKSSPLESVERLRGKLLIASSDCQADIPFSHTLLLEDFLIKAHKYAELALFPGRRSGIVDLDALGVLLHRMAAFWAANI